MTTKQIMRLDTAARKILETNDKGNYTIPTAGLYPYQWNWDSAFAAMGFATFNAERAWTELDTLFAGQWQNGMVPHILFHSNEAGYFPGPEVWGCNGPVPSSGITQPPVAATMAKRIFDQNPDLGITRLPSLYKKMEAWHQWFMQWRLDDGAVCITHPWESGRDNAPDWDGAMSRIQPVDVGEYTRRDTSHVDSDMRPTKDDYDRYVWLVQRGKRLQWNEEDMLQQTSFRVADPSMTFILLRAQRDLRDLGQMLGQDTSAIDQHIATLEHGTNTLWNEQLGSFDSRDALNGDWSNSVSNASFLCWYAGIKAPHMRTLLHDILSSVKYGVPSSDPRAATFDSKRYWRGPVWGVMNTLIGLGMEDQGLPEGLKLRQATADLISQHGFAEYFDPIDGSPAGGENFTWTAAIWLGWASPSAV